ncbi:MAG: chorismate synthase, partial [Bacteroidia bacterium]|nr:chorismate synthase [Bacteroidia bacterium]
VVIDGVLPNIEFDYQLVQSDLDKRKPGQSKITTERIEDNEFEVLSGLFDGKTTGAPLTIIVKNKNQQSADYDHLKDVFRPSHADYTYQQKYGIRDYRGGGRQSARETVARVMAGSVAKMILNNLGISIHAFVSQIHHIKLASPIAEIDFTQIETNLVRCPDADTANKMIALIEQVKAEGDSVGGIITCVGKGVPTGLGEPVFNKLHAELGKAMLSINACKGFEIGSGFESVWLKGSEHNDEFVFNHEQIKTQTNHSGGIQGGISNGMDIVFKTAFKPVSTIKQKQQTINTENENIHFKAEGRHDPCVVPRAVPIVEAMAALVLVDYYLLQKMYQ